VCINCACHAPFGSTCNTRTKIGLVFMDDFFNKKPKKNIIQSSGLQT